MESRKKIANRVLELLSLEKELEILRRELDRKDISIKTALTIKNSLMLRKDSDSKHLSKIQSLLRKSERILIKLNKNRE